MTLLLLVNVRDAFNDNDGDSEIITGCLLHRYVWILRVFCFGND